MKRPISDRPRRQPTASPEAPPSRSLRILVIAALAACVVAGALLSCSDIFDTDFGRHIAYGRLLLSDFGAVRSATMGQSPEILQQAYSYWLYEMLLAIVFDHLGAAGVVLLRAIVLGAAFFLAVLLSRRLGADLWTCTVGLAIALLISYERFLDRPEIFSFLAWVGALWILIRHRRTRSVWLLVPLQILWVNTHLWFGLLPILLGAFAVGDSIEGHGSLRRNGLLMGALVLATFIGPAGPGAWSSQFYIARFLEKGYSLPFQIGEMMSPFSGYGTNIGIWCFRITLPIVLLLAFAARRRLGWGTFLALLVVAALAARARRAMPLFGITTAVILPLMLTDEARRFQPRIRTLLPVVLVSATLVAGLLGTWSLLTGRLFLARSEDRSIAFALSPAFPGLEAARFIQREGVQGPIFNPPLTAGALVLMNGVRVPPFLDARWVGSPETITAYARLRQATDETVGEIWKRLDASQRFETVLLDFEKMPALLRHLSLNEPDWIPVHVDDRAVVFCRRGGKNASVVDRDADQVNQSRAEMDPGRERALGEEVVRFLSSRKPSIFASLGFPFDAYQRAGYAFLLDRRPDAQEAYLDLLRREGGSLWVFPNLAKVLSDIFWCLQKSDQPEAILALADFIETRGGLRQDQVRFLQSHKARAIERIRTRQDQPGR